MTATIQNILDNVYGQINETEYKVILNQFLRTYFHQPNILKWIGQRGHGTLIPLEYDERTVFEIPLLNDIEALDVRFDIPDKMIGISTSKALGRAVQIGGGFEISNDVRNTPYGGQDRFSTIITQSAEKLAQQEDILFIRGDTGTSLPGILNNAATVTNNGAWGVSSNGILTNVIKDIKAVNTAIANNGVPLGPIDCVLTNELYNVLAHEIKVYGDQTALGYLKPMLNGGDFFPSNNLLASVTQDKIKFTSTTTENIALFFLKSPRSFYQGRAPYPQWATVPELFKVKYGFKQKIGFAYPTGVTSKFVYKITGISTATS